VRRLRDVAVQKGLQPLAAKLEHAMADTAQQAVV
jgi:hypothetical protein